MEGQVKNKKKIVILSSIAIALLVLIVGVSYAFWQQTRVQEGTNYIASGCFGVQFEGNNPISLINSFPITSEDGMKTKPYTFTITNTCNDKAAYNVNLEALESTTINNTSVRVALDDTNKLYSEYDEMEKYYDTSIESRKLTSGRLEAGESITYNLRIWVDEKVTNEEQNKTFASKIVINANQYFDDPEITDLNITSTIDTINITYNANGDKSTTCIWGIVEGIYDNEVLEATNTNCDITGLTENTTYYYQICTETGKGSKCVDGNIKTLFPIGKVQLGDYIILTPTSTSYTLPNELSGCDGTSSTCVQNEINPSELNLWRVIRKNEDGTVEVVSEYVSSASVYFYGLTGYVNLVESLNMIASQYTDGKHVERTRHIGYSNQTGKIIDTSKLTKIPCPWSKPTSAYNQWTNCNPSGYLCGTDETKGAGDIGYETDYNLVNAVYGNMIGMKLSGTSSSYCLASRRFHYGNNTIWYFGLRYVDVDGALTGDNLYYHNDSGFGNKTDGYAIRPILTLRSEVVITTGDGKSADTAYRLK